MKNKYSILICVFFASTANVVYAQNYINAIFENNIDGALQKILLHADSTYCIQSISEKDAQINFGTYRIKKDSIYFTEINTSTFVPIVKQRPFNDGKSVLQLRFFDKNDVVITDKITVAQYGSNATPFYFKLDSSKQYCYNKGKTITVNTHIITMEKLLGKNFTVNFSNYNMLDVYLDVKSSWLPNKAISWGKVFSKSTLYYQNDAIVISNKNKLIKK